MRIALLLTLPPLALATLAGCDELFPEDARIPISTATDTHSGRYVGQLELVVRATWGPILLKQDACSSEVELYVDPDAGTLITGEATCDFTEFEPVTVDLYAELVELPTVEGMIDAPPVEAEWTGRFVDNEHLWGEARGAHPWRAGIDLDYDGWLDVYRVAPLTTDVADGGMGGG